MTVTGQIKTVLVTPTSAEPAATSSASLPKPNTAARGISTGKVVGIVIGVALGLGLLIGLGVFFWLRRKHRNSDRGPSPDGSYHSGGRAPLPSRQVSQMSSSTLLGKTPMLQTKGLGPSDTVRSAGTGSSGFDRRSLGTDQRLNPNALYAHEEAAISSVSLQDNHDYSRQLRVSFPTYCVQCYRTHCATGCKPRSIVMSHHYQIPISIMLGAKTGLMEQHRALHHRSRAEQLHHPS